MTYLSLLALMDRTMTSSLLALALALALIIRTQLYDLLYISAQEPNPVLSESMEEGEGQGAVELAMSWKRKLYVQRAKESISAPRGARGLRKLNKFRISTPSVVDVIKPSDENMKSPTKY